MTDPTPHSLPENAGLAFLGERVDATRRVSDKIAERMLRARNPHGKPNADVLRQVATAAGTRQPSVHWQIDFPAGMDAREASLYEQPFQHLSRAVRSDRDHWWANPCADNQLRAVLARRERYLVTPVATESPDFRWIEAAVIPDDTLLAVARDDDFTHGVLQSALFALWWRRYRLHQPPTLAVESFPFPWPPFTALSALSKAQEEQRHAIARAARSSAGAELDATVMAAYGWPADLSDDALVARLWELNVGRDR